MSMVMHAQCATRSTAWQRALGLNVLVVSNGSRPIRPPGTSNVSMVLVGDSADAADDWIAERIGATDVCVTSDIPLASRCLKKGGRVVSPTGKQWTEANIGNALTGRDIARGSGLSLGARANACTAAPGAAELVYLGNGSRLR